MTKYKVIENPDVEMFLEVSEKVRANDGYCPCKITKTLETKCMCEEFRKQDAEGFCHCKRYKKILREN